ncbi:type II toxin-antitoxin system Phd/YefM family antitoxin [Candidatus Poriferisodalis sp.]|uniref:type II toxin-antitoxin system Phd/YefM family antitoxin n=1 Tax=Candidatus Poriferisodalis sp. TaxID=3101277 RepID=UPI003B52A8B9
MKQIGVRELRQNASEWLRRVADGESYEVTVRGEPVALLGPLPHRDDPMGRLAARGLIGRRARGLSASIEELPPLPAAPPGEPTLSDRLADLRRDER